MARERLKGLSYFPHDTVLDTSMGMLRKLHGNDGYATFWTILEMMYGEGLPYLDLSLPAMVDVVKERCCIKRRDVFEKIVQSFVDLGLFEKEVFETSKQLTNARLRSQLNSVDEKRDNDRKRKGNGNSATQFQRNSNGIPDGVATEVAWNPSERREEKSKGKNIGDGSARAREAESDVGSGTDSTTMREGMLDARTITQQLQGTPELSHSEPNHPEPTQHEQCKHCGRHHPPHYRPTIAEVLAYFTERRFGDAAYTPALAQTFFDVFQGTDWHKSNEFETPIADWRAHARLFVGKEKSGASPSARVRSGPAHRAPSEDPGANRRRKEYRPEAVVAASSQSVAEILAREFPEGARAIAEAAV